MSGKFYVRKRKISVFSLPFIALFLALAVGVSLFFGAVALAVLAVFGVGTSIFRKLFSRKGERPRPHVGGTGQDTITLGKDDYEIKDIDERR